jgi:HSP20 family protein
MPRTVEELMWVQALATVARVDRIQREFFHPAPPGWEPPVDLLETAEGLTLIVALPGVRAVDIELVIGRDEIGIIGSRPLPVLRTPVRIHRMELPHGRFERRVPLPPGAYELSRRDLADGCLTITLRKLG